MIETKTKGLSKEIFGGDTDVLFKDIDRVGFVLVTDAIYNLYESIILAMEGKAYAPLEITTTLTVLEQKPALRVRVKGVGQMLSELPYAKWATPV